jgi:hypothetical protein
VSLGDVSINKVPFPIAADMGIYVKNDSSTSWAA